MIDTNSNSNDDKNDWKHGEERLESWRMRAQRNLILHYASSKFYKKLHYLIGVPTIILAAIVSTLAFVGIYSEVPSDVGLYIAVLASLTTVLTALQTFFNHEKRSTDHQKAKSMGSDSID